MERFQRQDGSTYGVTSVHGESGSIFYVVDCNAPEPEQPAVVASYWEKWRADNHAIQGCSCIQNWHLYHGRKHEESGTDVDSKETK